MKNILAVAAILFAVNICGAQSIKSSKVPVDVKSKFETLYSNVKEVKWEKENGNYEASFKNNDVNTSVIIDPLGNLIETEVVIKTEELPASATEYIKQNYSKYTLKGAAKITDVKGTITYEAEISKGKKHKDVIFDASGNVIK